MWSLEPSQQCENFFSIIVLFVGHLPGGSMVGLMVTCSTMTYGNIMHLLRLLLSEPLYAEWATVDPHFHRRPSDTHR